MPAFESKFMFYFGVRRWKVSNQHNKQYIYNPKANIAIVANALGPFRTVSNVINVKGNCAMCQQVASHHHHLHHHSQYGVGNLK
jgi:hypothetical protein